MTVQAKPIPKRVKDEIRRQRSPIRFAGPVALAILNLIMFFAVAGGCLFGIYFLWMTALEDDRFRMDGETLYLAGAVRECPESVASLETIGRRFDGRSLLDPRLIGDMNKAYEESVWVKRVLRLRRRFPNRVEVKFLLRLPAAQVWHGNRYWLVDSEASLLPVEGSLDKFAALPEIVGVTPGIIGNRPAFGGRWNDEGVSGAVDLLRAFWGSPLAEVLPIERVVVNAGILREGEDAVMQPRRRFEIVTPGGAVIRWGTHNPGNLRGELTSSEKLWQLQELLGRDEALRAGVCFDVRTRLPGYSLID